MPPFKDQLDASAGERLARELSAAWSDFPADRFTHELADALAPLELMARGDELATRLIATLPADFPDAADVLHRATGSPTFSGWIVIPCGAYVARAGLADVEHALPLLAALTPRASSEFAIRPFIDAHPTQTYAQLVEWTAHPDEHVRRLVSEGTRPRLPWGRQLRGLVADPSPNLPLLEKLVDDPSTYVRRSVANHLNDITKDHPDLALDVAEQWSRRGPEAEWVVRHALRTLVKRGDRRALQLIGVSADAEISLSQLSLNPAELRIGETATFTFALTAAVGGPAVVPAVIDYAIHYVGARGTAKAPKVFKLTRRQLAAGEAMTITRKHRFDHVSIRTIHPGRHRLDVLVNGAVLGTAWVDVIDAAD